MTLADANGSYEETNIAYTKRRTASVHIEVPKVSKLRRDPTRLPELYVIPSGEYPQSNPKSKEYSHDEVDDLKTSLGIYIFKTHEAFVFLDNVAAEVWNFLKATERHCYGICCCQCKESAGNIEEIGKKRFEVGCLLVHGIQIQAYIDAVNNAAVHELIHGSCPKLGEAKTQVLAEEISPDPMPLAWDCSPLGKPVTLTISDDAETEADDSTCVKRSTELSQDELLVQAFESLAGGSSHQAPENFAVGDQFAELPLSDLVYGPCPRIALSYQSIDEMLAHIMDNKLIPDLKKNGMKLPIVVRPYQSPYLQNKYEVLDGNRRKQAAEVLKWHTIKVVIKTLSDAEAYEFALMADNKRKELSEYELGRWLYILLVKFPMRYPTHDKLAECLDLKQPTVSQLIKFYIEKTPGLQKNQVKKVGRPTRKARRHHP